MRGDPTPLQEAKAAAKWNGNMLAKCNAEVLKLRPRIAELERLEVGLRAECHEVEQRLGRALGYPLVDHRVCERCDPETGCTCGTPVVCVGEHVSGTIAAEAATRIAELEAALAASRASRERLAEFVNADMAESSAFDSLTNAEGDRARQVGIILERANARKLAARAALLPEDLA